MRNGQAGLCRWGWMKEGLGKYSKAKSSEGDSPGECALSEKSQDGSGHAGEGQNQAMWQPSLVSGYDERGKPARDWLLPGVCEPFKGG